MTESPSPAGSVDPALPVVHARSRRPLTRRRPVLPTRLREGCAALLILICWGPALLAQVGASQSPPAHPDSALATALAALPGDRIVLDDAVAAALEQSAAAREAEARYAVARAALRRERGVFDPELYASWRYSDNQAPTASFFSGASVLQTEETTLAGGLRWQLHTGTRLEAALNSVRLNTNSSFAFLNPQYDAFGSITVRQSLLSGLWIGGRRDLAAAEREAEAARARRDRAILAVRGDVERAYWDLYAGERDLAVQELIVERARVLLEEARVRAASGLVGPNQVANARVFLAEQELNRLDANERLAALSDALAARIGRRPPGGERYRSVDRPAVTTAIPATDDLLATAMEANPELEALRGDIETFSVQARAAGWDVLPRLDLVGTIGGSGLAGNARPVVFGSDTLRTTVSGGQGDAISEALSRDFPNWSVGVELSIPIGALWFRLLPS